MDGKKKLVQINTVCNTSTGRIMGAIQREAMSRGYEAVSYVGRRMPFGDIPCVKFGSPVSFWLHVAQNTLFDRQGYSSFFQTRKLIRKLRQEKPDIIHLHNLHGYYLNLPVLFRYLTEEFKGRVFWTFHDCWPFTGHCPYFTMAACDKWKAGCGGCPNKRKYPVSLFADRSRKNYEDKKKLFSGLSDLNIVVPSEWMKGLVQESFFKDKRIYVVPNGIDLSVFSYRKSSGILEKYGIPEGKKILFGVAAIWDERKGLKDFLELSEMLPEKYHIVLVGLSGKQIKRLPGNITGIMRTENQKELAALYSCADIFINPSLEESFSLVTVEAFACGTPVIALDTSAVKELINEQNGIVLKSHEPEDYLQEINKLEEKELDRGVVSDCAKKYDNHVVMAQMVDIYEKSAF